MKLNPKVYKEAAEKIDNGSEVFACVAVAKTADYPDTFCCPYARELRRIFKPGKSPIFWYDDMYDYVNTCRVVRRDKEFNRNSKLGRLGRSLMLLFMYEIVKDRNGNNKC